MAERPTVRVVLLGDVAVGKTCLRAQFVHRVFLTAYKATIGGDFLTASVEVGSHEPTGEAPPKLASPETVSVQVWDTAGQERFNLISQAFYRGADVALLVYDVTNYESFLSTGAWLTQFLENCQSPAPAVLLVGNKLDRDAERSVDPAEVREILARARNPVAAHIRDWDRDVFDVLCKDLLAVDAVFRRAALLGLEGASKKLSALTVSLDRPPAPRCAC